MEVFILEKDIRVFYIKAKSFPKGVLEAHQQLHTIIPFSNQRRYFGISRPEKGTIEYWAAAEELKEGESEQYNCDSFTISKGEYISIEVRNYIRNIEGIGEAFNKLIMHEGIDPQGYCLEWYLNDEDVRCMIRLKP
jgi:hypothetical protein